MEGEKSRLPFMEVHREACCLEQSNRNVIKKKTGKYNIVMVVNILYTKGVKQNHYARIGYPAEGKCPQDRY